MPDLAQQEERIRFMERDLGVPVRALIIGMLFYYLYFSSWFEEVTTGADPQVALKWVRNFFLIYVLFNTAVGSLLLGMKQLAVVWLKRVVFSIACIDALFVSVLASVTGAYDSILFWVFLGLVVRNAVSMPEAGRQLALNAIVTGCYLLSSALETAFNNLNIQSFSDKEVIRAAIELGPQGTEPFLLRLFLLVLMTVCCLGVQVLFDKDRRAADEARDFHVRHEQLQAMGRLAAEIAHQLKNPLGIINNAVFNIGRLTGADARIQAQLSMIQEEVQHSDRILTELMGYARLTEGRVEKLDVTEELDRAIEQVFPPEASYMVQIERDYAPALPMLLVQRAHLSEVFLNLLQNAREALDGQGRIQVSARYGENYSVVVKVADNGPGISEENVAAVFEPYYTTKVKGTGLGLAIVRHNTELYGGTVAVESEIGKGTLFTVSLPAKTLMKIRR